MTANLDLVRSIYTLWECGDHRYWADSEIQYATVGIPEPAGPDSAVGSSAPPKESFREWLSAWSDWKAAAENYIELDREHVLVPYKSATPGKARRAGPAPRRTRQATLFHVRAHRVTRIVQYYDCQRAFADLGLSSEGDAAKPR
jgi:ketosteroid isomerase-like protein